MKIAARFLGVALIILALGYALQQPWATATWMWPDGRLSYVFVGSILAAMATAILVLARREEWAAAAAGTMNCAATFGALAATLCLLRSDPALPDLNAHTWSFAAVALWSIAVAVWWSQEPVKDPRPLPALVRYSFLAFVLLLFAVALGLFLRRPAIFPWPLKPATSLAFGSVFLGAGVYFLYGFLRPQWGIAQSQLAGFLACDLVLLGPYLNHFSTVKPAHQPSLMISLAVIVYSGLLATCFLFVNRETRLFAAQG